MLYQIMEVLTEKIWLFNAFVALLFTLFLIVKLAKDFANSNPENDDTNF